MPATTNATLYLFSGNSAKILEHQRLPVHSRIVPFSEKQLLSVAKTLKMLRADSSEYLVFGAYSLDLQRYSGILAVLLLFAGKFSGAFADESGNILRINPLRTIFVVVPLLIVEAAAGIFMVIASYFRLITDTK